MTGNRRVIVTGGAGFIGSHTCKRLAAEGIEPITYDNLSSGHRHNVKWGPLVVGDILDGNKFSEALKYYRPETVIHFAALAYVGESVTHPERYYHQNVQGTLNILSQMLRANIKSIVFSSTCATYGTPSVIPIRETEMQRPINPYGASKLMVERILDDYHQAYGLSFTALRYFNACGADPEGELCEQHNPETHLIPLCLLAAAGLIEAVEVFGDDYPTPDGTCIRDYIHVSDLADAHVNALQRVVTKPAALKLNLGTGQGISVRQVLEGIRSTIGREVPFRLGSRRLGDPPVLFADPTEAQKEINFIARYSSLETIIRTAWRSVRPSY